MRLQMIMLGLATLAGLTAGLLIARNIRKPLLKVTSSIQRLANVDLAQLVDEMRQVAAGDLTRSIQIDAVDLDINSTNEMGQMAAAYNTINHRLIEIGQAFDELNHNLRGALEEVSQSAAGLSTASDQLATAAIETTNATEQISSTIQQVAVGTSEQSNEANRTAAAMEQMTRSIDSVAGGAKEQERSLRQATQVVDEMSQMIDQVARSVESVQGSSGEAIQAALVGAKTVENTIHGMQTILKRVNQAVVKIQDMGNQWNKIGDIVSTIDDIASQTNLLALNAAIEAARAGEHGRGFAVVADEVRKLAEKSAVSTREIGALIKAIRASINDAVQAMNESSHEVETGVALANDSGQALGTILAAIEIVSGQAGQTAGAAKEMESASERLVNAGNDVSHVTEENTAATEEMMGQSSQVNVSVETIVSVSEENSAAVEEVSASTQEMLAQVEEVSASAQRLADTAQHLKSLVSRFKLNEGDVIADRFEAKMAEVEEEIETALPEDEVEEEPEMALA